MSANIQEIKKLNELHVRGLRICFKIQGKIDNNELISKANISNLINRRKVHLRNYMFQNKSKCEMKPENIIGTRENSGPPFKISKPNREVFKRNVYYSGCIEWNQLNSEDRKIN